MRGTKKMNKEKKKTKKVETVKMIFSEFALPFFSVVELKLKKKPAASITGKYGERYSPDELCEYAPETLAKLNEIKNKVSKLQREWHIITGKEIGS